MPQPARRSVDIRHLSRAEILPFGDVCDHATRAAEVGSRRCGRSQLRPPHRSRLHGASARRRRDRGACLCPASRARCCRRCRCPGRRHLRLPPVARICSGKLLRSFRLRRCGWCCCRAITIPRCRTPSTIVASSLWSTIFMCSVSRMRKLSCWTISDWRFGTAAPRLWQHGSLRETEAALAVLANRRGAWALCTIPDRTTRLRPSWLIGDDELAATGADYVALGHWNRAAKVGSGVPAYYSGSPEYAGTVNLVRLRAGSGVAVTLPKLDIAREPSAA